MPPTSLPLLLLTPQAVAAEAHDIGHLLREAQRELARLNEPERVMRLGRLLLLAQDHCDSLIESAAILRSTAGDSNSGITVPKTEVVIGELLSNEVELWRPHAAASSLTIQSNSPKFIVFGNAGFIRRALRNLVLNAISGARPDSVISVVSEAPSSHALSISVSNVGRPIDPEISRRLANPHDLTTYSKGLGLVIAARVAAVHSGKLAAQHSDGVTTVTFTIETKT